MHMGVDIYLINPMRPSIILWSRMKFSIMDRGNSLVHSVPTENQM